MPSRPTQPLDTHLVHLDLNSFKELPDTHSWTPQSQENTSPLPGEGIPIIDLNHENVTELIGHACKTWGVFQITNHNISKSLLERAILDANRLFSLPMQQKLRASRTPDGVTGYGVARISSFFPKLMWSEGFTISGSPVEHARQLWPKDYYDFCNTIEEYKKAMNKLSTRLMWLMLTSLGITKEDIKWANPDAGSAALQLNSYPACPDPDRAMGLAAHTDSTILTILHQSNTSGLQVRRDGDGDGEGGEQRWITVPPREGTLVVNVGDLMHILSNGLYPSVVHRAMVNRTRHRFSVAYLYGPPQNVKIGPLMKLVDGMNPPLYRPVTWSEYLGRKAKHFDKALTSVRLCAPRNGFVDTNDCNSVKVG